MSPPLSPQPQKAARQDEAENKQRGHDEGGQRVENQYLVHFPGLERKRHGAERKDSGEQQYNRQAAEGLQKPRFASGAHSDASACEVAI